MRTQIDRSALVRRAMVEVIAERGLYGASMSLVARHAGVATGTAYVHYDSKEDLLIAAFLEVKATLAEAGLDGVDTVAEPREVFGRIWRNCHDHLAADPATAQFLFQVEASPIRKATHDALADDDPLRRAAEAIAPVLVDLPLDVLYDLSLGAAVRLVASGTRLDPDQLEVVIESCWRAVHRA